MDVDKMYREKARRELHKNATSYFEQIQEAMPLESTAVQPLTSYLKTHPSKTKKTYWRSKDEIMSDVLLWTPTHGRAGVGRPTRTYRQQLCVDTGCTFEDMPGIDRW